MGDIYFTAGQMSVGYDGVPLIREIEIRLRRGEILTLIGPNGAGKSTILKSITGQLPLLCGTLNLGGRPVERMTEKELSREMAVVLTQRIRPELMTCREVAATGRYPYTGRFGFLSKEDERAVEEAMRLVHISELSEKEFLRVSDGQRQRVMLARAICQEPKILILDEPTSYLDIKYKLEFLSVLQKLTREKGLSVIMSLHELDLAQRVSDRLLCVKGEWIDRCGAPEEIFKENYINRLYEIKEGSYDEASGRAELPAASGKPELFVISGGGSGTCVYRRLQRMGIPFSTGILWENDIDFPAARALAVKVIAQKAFERVKRETREEARAELGRCKGAICCLTEFGELNQENRELMEEAKSQGKLIEIPAGTQKAPEE